MLMTTEEWERLRKRCKKKPLKNSYPLPQMFFVATEAADGMLDVKMRLVASERPKEA